MLKTGDHNRHTNPTRRTVALLGVAALSFAHGRTARAASREDNTTGAAGATPRADLYACEGCDGAYERNAATLDWQTQMAPAGEPGEKLRVEGVVLQTDGRTPARDVVIYAYHTDAAGHYSRGKPGSEWSRRHGLLRGWVKTGASGHYRFDTIKPAPYPNEIYPAHVHLTVLEPRRRPYWIDDVVFAGEFGVTDRYRRERENRGGDGIVTLLRDKDIWIARRNIILEHHP